ncbi:helix-turn-helix domain-containing protein [Lacticaseibacillus paracasei]|uniref:helix-turn-helix domain-containing protein n=1 Tax=Lacticaseibacillus paracasei TaxID=1597 RepID=UPI002349EA44|nr:helix-turn-helix domain-containing protein [Lacticaseibacillus paracasei]MDC6272625.1 helix-turn-helix domain-containing protein [Lacticaseibacillus paracasei]MDN4555387.1 helix-turn-helix domain-containing protein [Lacticaseibacillus paracasei]
MASMKAELVLSKEFDKQLQEQIHQEVIRVIREFSSQHVESQKLNIGQAAEYANVSRNTISNWTKRGLSVQVVGGVKRISTADIDDYMNNHGK